MIFFTLFPSSGLILLKMLSEYIDMNNFLPALSSEIVHRVVETLKFFNTRTCQLVLGAGAMQVLIFVTDILPVFRGMVFLFSYGSFVINPRCVHLILMFLICMYYYYNFGDFTSIICCGKPKISKKHSRNLLFFLVVFTSIYHVFGVNLI